MLRDFQRAAFSEQEASSFFLTCCVCLAEAADNTARILPAGSSQAVVSTAAGPTAAGSIAAAPVRSPGIDIHPVEGMSLR